MDPVQENKQLNENTCLPGETVDLELESEVATGYLDNWRLHLLTIGLCLSVFLSSLDITIVSTSLASIANDLKAFDQAGWIVSSYLTTYFSFIIIWAKLSDIFGRKLFLMIAILLFIVFSGACGGSQTALQLYDNISSIPRSWGAGIFAMTPAIISEMVPPEKFATYNAVASSTIGISFLLGPLVGGAISNRSSWRWIFFINIPVGALAITASFIAMPSRFPHQSQIPAPPRLTLKAAIGKVDFPGFFCLLSSCLLLVCGIQEAGIVHSWSSGLIITLFSLSGVFWALFILWQRLLNKLATTRKPVFPWRFMTNRVLVGVYLTALLAGISFTSVIIELPQQFQAVNNISPLLAGVWILPFSLSCATSSALTGLFTSKLKIPPIIVITVGTGLQTIGLTLLYTLPVSLNISVSHYGFQTLAGFGVLTLTTILSLAPFVVSSHDRAVALGGVTQFRVLGGAVGVSVATNLLNNHVNIALSSIFTRDQVAIILHSTDSIARFDAQLQSSVRMIFAAGYKLQLGAVLGFTAAQFLGILLMWERRPRTIP